MKFSSCHPATSLYVFSVGKVGITFLRAATPDRVYFDVPIRHFTPCMLPWQSGVGILRAATPDRRNFVCRPATSLVDRRRYPTGSTMFCFAALRLLALPSLEKQKRRNPRLQTRGREVSGLEGTTPYSQNICPKTQAFGRQRRKFCTCRGYVFDNDNRASKTHPPGSTVIGCSRDLETFCSQLWEPVDIEFESGLGTFSAPSPGVDLASDRWPAGIAPARRVRVFCATPRPHSPLCGLVRHGGAA